MEIIGRLTRNQDSSKGQAAPGLRCSCGALASAVNLRDFLEGFGFKV